MGVGVGVMVAGGGMVPYHTGHYGSNWDLRVGFPSFSFALFSHLASSPQQKTPEFVKTP